MNIDAIVKLAKRTVETYVALNNVETTLPVNVGQKDVLTIEHKVVTREYLNECDVINMIGLIDEAEISEKKFWDIVNSRIHDER